MLLKTIAPSDLDQHPALLHLVKDQFDRVDQIVQPLIDAQEYQSDARSAPVLGRDRVADKLSPQRSALLEATRSGGFAVRSALALCKGKTAASRMYGAELLFTIYAT